MQRLKYELLASGLDRLPHALLLSGPAGVGKTAFFERIAAALLCVEMTKEFEACGHCQACRWLAVGNHPDIRRVAPEEDAPAAVGVEGASEKTRKRGAAVIRIDQIRQLEDFVFIASHRQRRVILMTQADAMNTASANALLKILEEPPPGVYFLLVTDRLRNLLPTIRSRCRVLTLGRPDAADAAQQLAAAGLSPQTARYLDLAGGAPLRVLQWHEQGHLKPFDALIDSLASPPGDPLALAARWDGLLKGDAMFRLEHLVEEVQRWLFDRTLQALSGTLHYHRSWSSLSAPAPSAGAAKPLLHGWQEVLRFRRSARHPLNQLLFLEDLATHTLNALRSSH
ncbi:MAG TPA: DNA polymerase III subunit delta' [Rhodocyclaceae bacterium]|nr:DNA polymerase III subunit delta' [Rhodocyclaceae bacterium]